jgi:hypothetical protein
MNYNLTHSTPVDLRFSTDNSANITAWQVEIFSNAGPFVLSQNIPSVQNSGFDKVLSSGAQQLALHPGWIGVRTLEHNLSPTMTLSPD